VEKLKEYRKKTGLSQQKLAKLVGISKPYYNQLENGSRRFNLPVAKKVASILAKELEAPVTKVYTDIFLP